MSNMLLYMYDRGGKLVKERIIRRINIFYIVAFTIAFLSFSMGYSAIHSEKNRLQRYDGETNKSLSIRCDELYSSNIKNILKEDKISFQLMYPLSDSDSNKQYDLITDIKVDGINRLGDLRYGRYLNENDYEREESIAVFSSSITSESEYSVKVINEETTEEILFKEIGRTFDTEAYLNVSNKDFFKIVGTENLVEKPIVMIISGEKKEIDKSISKLKKYVDGMEGDNLVEVYSYNTKDIERETHEMFFSFILILLIITINSITISYLWVEDNKKELVVRKVCGANNIQLTKIFFGKLLTNAIVAVFIAITLQYICVILFKGMMLDIDIRISFLNLCTTIITSIGVSFIASLPAFIYIGQVQPSIILKGE